MQLIDGVCTVHAWENAADRGDKPVDTWPALFDAWFGELEFVSVPAFRTELREDIQVDRRIRILHHPEAKDARAVSIGDTMYQIVRTFIGTDDESGERIMDLSLRRWADG